MGSSELGDFKGLHAHGRLERTLCGFAPEAFESGDSEQPIVFAEPGQVVTCRICRAEIDHIRANFNRYRYTGH